MHPKRILQAMTTFRAKVVMTIAVLALGFVAAFSPAFAFTVDQPRIDTAGSDFGANELNGSPFNGGLQQWLQVGNKVNPVTTGEMFLDQPAGVQAYIEVEYYKFDAAGNHVLLGSAQSLTKTATAAALDTFSISISSFSHKDVVHVHIKMWDNSSGAWAVRQTVTEDI